MDLNTQLTWQHAVVFLGGIALQYLATKLTPATPVVVPTSPVAPSPVSPVAPLPPVAVPSAFGDGHVIRDIIAQLITALQASTPPVAPVAPVTKP